MKRVSSLCLAVLLCSVEGCSDTSNSAPPPPPPPPPALPVAPPVAPVPDAPAGDSANEAAKPSEQPRAAANTDTVRETERKPAKTRESAARERPRAASKSKEAPIASAPRPSTPATPPPSPAPALSPAPEKPRGKVNVPSTEHVRMQIPSGLQADLDKDPRMQPWANQVISVIDRCYTSTGSSPGTIEVRITMHENSRPDADLGGVPNGLAPVVACATGGLMRTKMPLFTGAEGARYTVRINFQ